LSHNAEAWRFSQIEPLPSHRKPFFARSRHAPTGRIQCCADRPAARNLSMDHPFTLDAPSFQKLLEAAWVLQCERDRELNESHYGLTALAVPPAQTSQAREIMVSEIQLPEIPLPEIPNPSVPPGPLTVAPIYQGAEVAGALALAADLDRPPLPDPQFPAPDLFKKPTQGADETAAAQIGHRGALTLVPFRNRDRDRDRENDRDDRDKDNAPSPRAASTFQRASRVTAAYSGPVAVLLIMLTFLFSLLGVHPPALTAAKAALLIPKINIDKTNVDRIEVDKSAIETDKIAADKIAAGKIAAENIAVPAPTPDHLGQPQSPVPKSAVPEPSHLRVTDPAASSLVTGLSRYEMQTVRQQAQYGDAAAALTLGMAYEIGRHVPRSCTEAAHWVAVAAEEGNSAAQYNLALRYISGDGIPTNLDEARKWLARAARRGYQKARFTLQASRQ
jgi:hypothetical protein